VRYSEIMKENERLYAKLAGIISRKPQLIYDHDTSLNAKTKRNSQIVLEPNSDI
jgi:hypothetical protein